VLCRWSKLRVRLSTLSMMSTALYLRTLLSTRGPLSQHLLAAWCRGCSTRSTTTSTSSRRCLCVLLCVDLLDNLLNLLCLQVADLVSGCHDCNLDVFRASLHDLEKRFDGQLDGARAVEGVGVVALEELAHSLGGASNGVCFPGMDVSVENSGKAYRKLSVPCAVDTTGLSLVKPSLLATRVEAHDECANAEWPYTTTLRIPLLHTSHVFGDVLDAHGILDSKSVTLGFEAGFVDEDAGVGVQTSEGETDVVVDKADLGGSDACVLQLHGGLLFTAEHDDLAAFDSDGAGAALDGLEGIFDLEDMTVG